MTLAEWGVSQGLTMNFLEVMGCVFIGILVGTALIGLTCLLCGSGESSTSDSTKNTNKNEGGDNTKRD